MLDMGFIVDIKKIISHTPKSRQTMLFSATMPQEIRNLAQSVMRNPETVSLSSDDMTVEEINQNYYEVSHNDKFDCFVEVTRQENPESAIVFCNTKRWADTLTRLMRRNKLNARSLHGDMPQTKRDKIMKDFRSGKVKYLVATDVAARGLDIRCVSHVFNYDVPQEPKNYVHRIGRTGRAGETGKAITFISPREIRSLWDIEHQCRTSIPQAPLPANL
ncbi:MAG: hypothetical protein GF334_07460 [Candidatus Altiarchaeales archaeon]|nr:hypothetical protein [Candidatus Altiarchaeales archaeon]